jgi:hypothetical protein
VFLVPGQKIQFGKMFSKKKQRCFVLQLLLLQKERHTIVSTTFFFALQIISLMAFINIILFYKMCVCVTVLVKRVHNSSHFVFNYYTFFLTKKNGMLFIYIHVCCFYQIPVSKDQGSQPR